MSTPKKAAQPAPRAGVKSAVALALIAIGVLAAYHGTFGFPFVFDDTTAIPENPSIRSLWPIWRTLVPPPEATTMGGRPLANLTLAFNYAVSGTQVWSYHVFNVAVLILGAWTLFGVVRRTLASSTLKSRFGEDSLPLALAATLLWCLHPMQAESVTYVVQRVESLVGLFYLLSVYCFIRAADAPNPLRWQVCTGVVCLLGMATKEVMVTAPVMLLLYDRTFISGSFLEAWKARRRLYLCLAATWVLLAALVASTGWSRGGSAGFGSASAWSYWLTQVEAIPHYLRLSLWPSPLVFDYGSHLVRSALAVAPYALAFAAILAAVLVCLRKKPALGFLGSWVLLILAPSSTVPVATQTMAEHRMYLPLAAIAVLGATGLYAWIGKRSWIALGAVAIALGGLTELRNRDFSSNLALWRDTANKRPDNARAHNNLGLALFRAGEAEEAVEQYQQSLRIEPGDQGTHSNLGNALDKLGRTPEAIEQYRAALKIQPDFAPALYNLAQALHRRGKDPEAIQAYEAVIRIQPTYAEAYNGLGEALVNMPGRADEAATRYQQALHLKPDFALAHFNLAGALSKDGHTPEAINEYEEALRIEPGLAEASDNLGVLLCSTGRVAEGIQKIEASLQISPDNAKSHFDLANAQVQTGQINQAIRQYQEALRIEPGLAEADNNLGMILCRSGRLEEGLRYIEAAIRTKPSYAPAHFIHGIALMQLGRKTEAIAEFEEVLRLRPGDPSVLRMLEMARNSAGP